jgi:hypothetical protein
MKHKLLSFLLILIPTIIFAQSPVSGFMKEKGQASFVISHSSEKYDEVYFVPSISDAVPIFRDVKIQSQSLYAEYGVSNTFNIVVNIPYITVTGNATESSLRDLGFENKRSGFQDLKIYSKYNFVSYVSGKHQIDFIGVLGVELPMGYNANEGLQSIIAIGDEAKKLNFSGIMMYKNKSGLFGSAQIGNTFKDNRVPNAFTSEWKLGFAAKRFYVDAFFATQLNSSSGVDILQPGFDGFFPATKVNFTRIGLNAYVPFSKYIGLTAGANKYISGRNLGIATGFYGGLVLNI